MYISEGTARRILKAAGAGRVSGEAASEFQKKINRYSYDVGEKAVRLAKHAKRKTVTDSDVKLAAY